ncbi:hypothetical protein D0B54_04485 [Solimonas sp. K1W22B-7]|nr:phage integrase N-terminal SAM-like domain-containing protein [Solimonas sp. K1W22B-7]AXQ27977.1 hypothetical protein D0B54_04485 [Solimonas sp. K1W22B-7]
MNIAVRQPPKLLDQVRNKLRAAHYSIRTEQSCIDWVRRYILFHGKRHPKEMGATEDDEHRRILAWNLAPNANSDSS